METARKAIAIVDASDLKDHDKNELIALMALSTNNLIEKIAALDGNSPRNSGILRAIIRGTFHISLIILNLF